MTVKQINEPWQYNPDWQTVWQRHKDAFDASGSSDADALQSMQDAWTTQFETASAFADHIIGTVADKAKRLNLVWSQPDTSGVKTKSEANAAYREVNDFVDQQLLVRHRSLPVDNSGLFAKENSHATHAAIATRNGHVTDTIITIQRVEDKTNICFTHLKENHGTSVINAVEELATTVAQSPLLTAAERAAPEKIDWYTHLPAGETSLHEKLDRVAMTCDNGKYRGADFIACDAVPAALKLARFRATGDEVTLTPTRRADVAPTQSGFGSLLKRLLG